MGLRFHKSIKVADGVKINLGTKSAGVSVGGKYGGVSFNSKNGTTVHATAPGTGLSYSQKIGSKKKSKSKNKSKSSAKTNIITALIVVAAIVFLVYKNWDTISEKLGIGQETTTESTTTTTSTTSDSVVTVSEDTVTYVLNTNTKKVHLESCQYAGDGDNFVKSTDSLDDIVSQGYEKCKKCLQ